MDIGKAGDRVVIESEQVGHPGREGEVLEVLGTSAMVHYRVRWEDGHESTFFPEMGSVRFISPVRAPARG